MKNKNSKSYLFMTAGLGLCSGVNLINRFIIPIPDTIEIIIAMTGLVFMIISIFINIQNKRNN